MSKPELMVVYDLGTAGFDIWPFPGAALILAGIGVFAVCFPRRAMEFTNMTGRPKSFWGFWILWVVFMVPMAVLMFTGSYNEHKRLKDAYLAGQYQVVEGPVENLAAPPPDGGSRESFSVGGASFTYSDNEDEPGFKRTRFEGGPIREGDHVRIAYIGPRIVRLEVEPDALAAAKANPPPPKPNGLRDGPFGPHLQYFLLLSLIFFFGGPALTWRLKGRKHIARDPSLRAGYNRMALGLFLWGTLPFLLLGLAIEIDRLINEPQGHELFMESISGPLFDIVLFLLTLLWLYWIFARDGAAKLARHPGLIDHQWVAKAIPLLVVAGLIINRAVNLIDWIE